MTLQVGGQFRNASPVLLQKSGFSQVANLAGGMLRWRAEALPFEQGAD